MNEEYAIRVKNVSKSFSSKSQKPKKGANQNRKSKRVNTKKILNGVSFSVKRGGSLGIIGTNGAGKSTLMKIIAGVMEPDAGEILTRGRVASLLELGIGFHSELSGRENIYIKGSTFGLSQKDVENRIDKIINFAKLDEYIDEPVRTYSSGMSARLAFAIAINVDADIILADEIFSVGDLQFKEKCTNVFHKMRKNGVTIIIISHGMGTIREMCDEVIWLREGTIFDSGNCKRVCDHYEKEEGESFKATMRSAEEGNDQAQNRLGYMYREGKGVENDYNGAFKWFKTAAEQGNREAQKNLGDLFSKGLGTEQNHEEALKWFLLSAEAGDQGAMMRIANAYRDGIGINVDRKNAFKWFMELAERGASWSQHTVAMMLLKGDGTEQNVEDAFKWCFQSAESGNSNARYQLGMLYREGIGTKKDIKESMKWLNLSALQGNVEAQVALTDILLLNFGQLENTDLKEECEVAKKQLELLAERGNINAQKSFANKLLSGTGTKQDPAAAFEWYLKAANAGDSTARSQVGFMYKNGIGTEIDLDEAITWFQIAAEQKNPGAMEAMAWLMMKGEGMEKDLGTAFELFKEVANLGNAWIRNQVGVMYRDGIGVNVNNEEARKYFELSAEQGNLSGRMNFADILSKSNDESDLKAAVRMYHKAASLGDGRACYRLALMYRDGIGTKADVDSAVEWFKKASDKNVPNALEDLQKLTVNKA